MLRVASGNLRVLTRSFGKRDSKVPAIGLDCMVPSGSYGPTNEKESIAITNPALELGCTLSGKLMA
jgi:aryl-alcohol dehydrogenase-like predicted oxidoreductase